MRLEYRLIVLMLQSITGLQHTEAEVVPVSSGHTDLSTGLIILYATAIVHTQAQLVLAATSVGGLKLLVYSD